ncbi:hypothetical protein PSX24_23265 [Shigella flexneri]|nr:hypothetical protein [Shigella flexneri]
MRPCTEDAYKIYCESFLGEEHLNRFFLNLLAMFFTEEAFAVD